MDLIKKNEKKEQASREKSKVIPRETSSKRSKKDVNLVKDFTTLEDPDLPLSVEEALEDCEITRFTFQDNKRNKSSKISNKARDVGAEILLI
ncbi:14434_t:CDS:2 [Entrophospora sp. SA101]|nr:14434_t:CDS:2 [Entrophospora sp. SA101]